VTAAVWAGLTPPYGAAMVDPPWKPDITQRLGGRGRRPAAPVQRYGCLTPHQVAELPVADLLADQAHVWLWVTNGVLAAGAHHGILEHWGARPVTVLTWCKPGGGGMGRYLRGATEHLVFGVRGQGTVPDVPWPTTWFESGRLPHSVKPPVAADIVEAVSPGPYVELFARQQRLGPWDS
jgi:N6-adenosine-specific RNA methylase IME4